jgi:hypothetical protein
LARDLVAAALARPVDTFDLTFQETTQVELDVRTAHAVIDQIIDSTGRMQGDPMPSASEIVSGLALRGYTITVASRRPRLISDEELDGDYGDSVTALAVEDTLTPTEMESFKKNCLTRQMAGADPADWICEMANADRFLDVVEPWFTAEAGKHLPELMSRHELPERAAARLLMYALYATVGITANRLETAARPPQHLAHAAAPSLRRPIRPDDTGVQP